MADDVHAIAEARAYEAPRGTFKPFAEGIVQAIMGGSQGKSVTLALGKAVVECNPPPRKPRKHRRPPPAAPQVSLPRLPRPPKARILDGFLLLEACGVPDPVDAVQAVLEGSNLTGVEADDLSFFQQLTHLDLGDNHIALESLAKLPVIQELHLDCNGISSLDLSATRFPHLQVLNLGYNGIGPACIPELQQLPALSELDLTCNGLVMLPEAWGGFGALKRLILDDNRLAGGRSLVSLSSAPALEHLSLQGNRFAGVPESCVAGGGFALLEVLNIAANRVAHEDRLVPLIRMPRLRCGGCNSPAQTRSLTCPCVLERA